jgi:hypothetical protein
MSPKLPIGLATMIKRPDVPRFGPGSSGPFLTISDSLDQIAFRSFLESRLAKKQAGIAGVWNQQAFP